MKHTYKFSIVTAIYNTEKYLEEMIESVINQDIGFEENVQLILVDDGSEDESVTMCEKYKKLYPNNISVLCLNHGGVSVARNEGIKLAKGKYINFLDSDDKLESNTLSEVEKFFKKHEGEIDLVAIPLYFFDAEQGEHILNYKFTGNRIIDIAKEYNAIQLSSSSTFIRTSILKEYEFNANLKYAEDAKLITDIILKRGKYGVINRCKYYYRRRKNDKSAIQEGYRNSGWYIEYIKNFSIYLINLQKDKQYDKYVKQIVIYDLQWRLFPLRNFNLYLNKLERKEFIKEVSHILQKVSFNDICNQINMGMKRKIILLILKILLRRKTNE